MAVINIDVEAIYRKGNKQVNKKSVLDNEKSKV